MDDIILCGSFGFGNVGDEAVVYAIKDILSETHPSTKVKVLSRFPKPELQEYGQPIGCEHLELLVEGSLRSLPLVVVGGGIFEPRSNSVASKCKNALTSLHRKSFFVAVGAEPAHYNFAQRRLIRQEVALADGLSARDNWSARVLKGILKVPVPVIGDIVLSMRTKSSTDYDSRLNSKYIVVSLCPQWRSPEWHDWISSELALTARSMHATIVFLPMASKHDEDVEMAEIVSNKLLVEHGFDQFLVIRGQPSAPEALSIISNSALVIGMRLHSCVMAAASGVPTIPIAYHPKLMGFASTLGIENLVIPALSFDEGHILTKWCFDSNTFVRGTLLRLAEKASLHKVDVESFRHQHKFYISRMIDEISSQGN